MPQKSAKCEVDQEGSFHAPENRATSPDHHIGGIAQVKSLSTYREAQTSLSLQMLLNGHQEKAKEAASKLNKFQFNRVSKGMR